MNNLDKKYTIVEWFEEDGNLYGWRGLSFDTTTNIVTKFTGEEEDLNERNLPDVITTIEFNENDLNERIKIIKDKLTQTETKRIPIEGGYKLSEPLSNKLRKTYLEELEECQNRLNFLSSLKIKIAI
jgi:hypothetical protein